MFAEVDVFVGNNTIVDPEIFQLWLDGYTAQDAATHVLQGTLKQESIPLDMLISDVQDHYRTFQMLERLLHSPPRLSEQWTFQITPSIQKMLIERYYEFDSSVIREFLGKKLSSRNRKDLDEVSEKTGIHIKSCRRQFDNVKRVYKVVDDMIGPLVQNIQNQFLLPENLARKYAAVVYLTNNRFETGKRKLQYLTFTDFLHCANQMMSNWSCEKLDCKYEETAMEMDREFLQELREMKLLLERDNLDSHKHVVLSVLKAKITERTYSDLENTFKTLSRTLVNIAYGLNHSKEVRDLFVDIVEKFIEPCRHGRWTPQELKYFLDVYTEMAITLNIFQSESHLIPVWERYMKTMSSCILQMYHI